MAYKNYSIVTSSSSGTMKTEIEAFLSNGWSIHGSLSVVWNDKLKDIQYSQAIVK